MDEKVLLYGIGNIGRQDDGLGIRCAEVMQNWISLNGVPMIDTAHAFQLNIEDAHTVNDYDAVVFMDASAGHVDGYSLQPLKADPEVNMSMHEVSPGLVAYLAERIYQYSGKLYLLQIKGHEWDFKEGLSPIAQENLEKSVAFLKTFFNIEHSFKPN